jgi:hypothetical protein
VLRTQDLSTDGAKVADALRKRAAALREQVVARRRRVLRHRRPRPHLRARAHRPAGHLTVVRPQQALGRPGTPVIPAGWQQAHGAVVAKTWTVPCEIRHPGGTKGPFDPTTGTSR